jgi:hypothetical protein
MEGYVFKSRKPLSNYSQTLTTIKDEAALKGDAVSRNTAKLLLNTLYGKFARTYYDSTTAIVTKDHLSDLERIYEIHSITHLEGGIIMVNYNNKPLENIKDVPKDHIKQAYNQYNIATMDKNTNIAISATITSHGRIILYKLYEEVLARGGVMCYSDTDSVYASLPESPFNKPFGPFIWDGKPEDNTYNKALFMAPKMYYTEAISGKITFKVKGVSTKDSKYNYNDLLSIFLNNTPMTFEDQLSFKSMKSKNTYLGLKIIEDLAKTYNIFACLKRN